MTKDKDFKRIVRHRMTETGETSTAAKGALDGAGPRIGFDRSVGRRR